MKDPGYMPIAKGDTLKRDFREGFSLVDRIIDTRLSKGSQLLIPAGWSNG